MIIDDKEIILLKVSGQDKPGVTAGLTSILATYDAIILDIGQADIHDTLSLGILFEIKTGSSSSPVLKDLLFKAYELGIKVKFIPISIADFTSEVLKSLSFLSDSLMADYKKNSSLKEKISGKTGNIIYQEYYPRISKSIIDEIDTVLAEHYGFTDEELDFIINYDIKYRMGKELENEDDE